MEKPQLKREVHEFYEYREVRDYLLSKYEHLTERHYRKFWRDLCSYGNISNGCYFWLNTHPEEIKDENEDIQEWKQAIQDEFGIGEFKFWVEW
jgi:hypothetical protein